MITVSRRQKLEKCLSRIDELTPYSLADILKKKYVDTGKYRSLSKHKMMRIYNLITYVIFKDFLPGEMSLEIAKRTFPTVVDAMYIGWVAVLKEMRLAFKEDVTHVE